MSNKEEWYRIIGLTWLRSLHSMVVTMDVEDDDEMIKEGLETKWSYIGKQKTKTPMKRQIKRPRKKCQQLHRPSCIDSLRKSKINYNYFDKEKLSFTNPKYKF